FSKWRRVTMWPACAVRSVPTAHRSPARPEKGRPDGQPRAAGPLPRRASAGWLLGATAVRSSILRTGDRSGPCIRTRNRALPEKAHGGKDVEMTKIRTLLAGALAIGVSAAALMASPALAQEPKTLRVTMHADVRVVDPFWTTQTIVGIHGMM